jgi:hypothetical protein
MRRIEEYAMWRVRVYGSHGRGPSIDGNAPYAPRVLWWMLYDTDARVE